MFSVRHTSTSTRSFALAAAASLVLAACGGGSEVAPTAERRDAGEVVIRTFDFTPSTIEVAPGATVIFRNDDDIRHTVTSGEAQQQGVPGVSKDRDAAPDGLFDHALDGAGATFEFTFSEPGTYDYFCSIHPGMTGSVIVR